MYATPCTRAVCTPASLRVHTARTPSATAYDAPCLRPRSALAPHCQQTPLAPSRTKRPRSRRHPVDNLWITCGKLTSYPRQPGSFPQATPTYPQVIHRLSTRYPQVNSLHSMRWHLTYRPDTATLVLLACCAYRHRSPIKYRMLLLLLLDLRSYSLYHPVQPVDNSTESEVYDGKDRVWFPGRRTQRRARK